MEIIFRLLLCTYIHTRIQQLGSFSDFSPLPRVVVRSVLFFFPTGQFDLFGDRQLSSVRRIQEQHLKEEMMMGSSVWTSAVLTALLLLVPRIDASGSNSALKAKVHTQFSLTIPEKMKNI